MNKKSSMRETLEKYTTNKVLIPCLKKWNLFVGHAHGLYHAALVPTPLGTDEDTLVESSDKGTGHLFHKIISKAVGTKEWGEADSIYPYPLVVGRESAFDFFIMKGYIQVSLLGEKIVVVQYYSGVPIRGLLPGSYHRKGIGYSFSESLGNLVNKKDYQKDLCIGKDPIQ